MALFAFAVATFSLVPAVQLRIITAAGDAPDLASGANQAAFNIANAVGAALGGAVIGAGFGYASPNVVAAGPAVVGPAVAVVAGRSGRRTGLHPRELALA